MTDGLTAPGPSRAEWYRETYDALATSYDFDDFPYYANEQRMIRQLLEQHVPRVSPAELHWAIDLGCGTGLHVQWLLARGYHVVGVDLSEKMLAVCANVTASHHERLRLVRGDLVTAELPPLRYVVALAFGSVLNHLEHWETLFARLARLLAPGGVALFNADNVLGLHQLVSAVYSHVLRRPGRRPLRELVARARHALSGAPFHSLLPVETAAGITSFPFTYLPYHAMRRLVAAAGLTIVDARGINALSSLMPAFALSESYRSRGRGVGRLAALLGDVDRRLAGRIVAWAGLQFVVCRR